MAYIGDGEQDPVNSGSVDLQKLHDARIPGSCDMPVLPVMEVSPQAPAPENIQPLIDAHNRATGKTPGL